MRISFRNFWKLNCSKMFGRRFGIDFLSFIFFEDFITLTILNFAIVFDWKNYETILINVKAKRGKKK